MTAHLSRAVTVGSDAVLPAGSRVTGVVTDATRSGKVKGLAHLAVRFTAITPAHGEEKYRMTTATIQRTAEATKKKDAVKIAAPAAGGAIIGGIVGGGKGALIGTAVGAGAGTAVVMSTRGEEVHLPKGSALTLKLSEPLTIRVRRLNRLDPLRVLPPPLGRIVALAGTSAVLGFLDVSSPIPARSRRAAHRFGPVITENGGLVPAFVVTVSLVDTVVVLGLVVVFLLAHGERPRDIFFGSRQIPREAVIGICR